jgi:2-oxoglutarate dehydrogenase E1 component
MEPGQQLAARPRHPHASCDLRWRAKSSSRCRQRRPKRFALEGGETALAIWKKRWSAPRAATSTNWWSAWLTAGLNILASGGQGRQTDLQRVEAISIPQRGVGRRVLLGATASRTSTGREIVVSVTPSAEAVDPVVEGIVRPKQDRLGDTARERVIPVLIHGDAAFAGQGVVAETLNLSQLDGYSTGGTIHLIINNQIGFTTLPDESRSTPYSTDIARGVQAPFFHVNGDDPDAAIRVVQIAFDSASAQEDAVIDMICYRRHGLAKATTHTHSPFCTTDQGPLRRQLYQQRLVRDGVATEEECAGIRKELAARLSAAYDAAQERAERYELQELSAVPGEEIGGYCPRTAVNQQVLERVIRGITHFPENFHLHPKLRGFVDKRRDVIAKGGNLDWAFGEALAFGTLALEGTAVRLSGQDSGRGTFSQRHLAFYDSENGKRYVPTQHISPDQGRFEVFDSSLSEYAVLGLNSATGGRALGAGDLGSAVRRFRQRRADHDRSVHLLLRTEVGTAQRTGDAAAPRLRRPGPRALERAHRAVPHALRGK